MGEAPDRIFATVNGMSTRLPDGGRQFVGGWSQDPERPGVTEYIRADLYAALEAKLAARTGGVKVKAMEWERENADGTVHYADSVLGEYSVWEIDGFGYWSHGGLAGRVTDGGLTGGKAAAQAEYERRVLSALSPAPEAQQARPAEQAVTEAMVEAALNGADYIPNPDNRAWMRAVLKAAMEAGG